MAFDVTEKNSNYIKNEAKNCLKNLPNELLDSKTNIYRFRLFEHLFMERCAIY